jgi:lipid II:glycine glycyltransferase (peptidoglycan interpeptide bridge formation enzyme)
MNKFYRLHLLTRKHQGIPTQPKRYFDQLWEQLLNKQLGFLLLAYKGTEVIAGAVFLNWNGILIYKYGASDRQNLSLRPNHAIFSTAIRWGSTNDCRLLDFGKTDIENQGLREFKSGWGANEEPLINSFLGDKPKGMGNGITNLVMNKIVRNTPPFTTRAFGEILYRHFA